MNLDTLETIRSHDPDQWETEPREHDYREFKRWVVETYGESTWREYHSNWDKGSDV